MTRKIAKQSVPSFVRRQRHTLEILSVNSQEAPIGNPSESFPRQSAKTEHPSVDQSGATDCEAFPLEPVCSR